MTFDGEVHQLYEYLGHERDSHYDERPVVGPDEEGKSSMYS